MYSTDTDDGSGLRSAGAVAMALVMVVSMLAIGGVAAGSAAAQPTADNYDPPTYPEFPDDPDDLDSDQFLVDDDFEDGEIDDNDKVFNEIGGAVDEADPSYDIFIREGDYEESVVVDTQVDLIGENAGDDQTDGVRLEGDGTGPALEIQADLVDVTEMTIVGNDAPAVQLTAQSSTDNVKDLDFLNNIVAADDGQVGFNADPMSMGSPFEQNVLFDNEFTVTDGATADTLVFIGGGVVTGEEQPDSYLIEDNEFRTQNAPPTVDDGLTTTSLHLEADDSEVLENDFPAEGAEGPQEIIVAGDSNELLSNDLDSDGFGEGILLAAGADLLVQDNTIDDADGNGVFADAGTADVVVDDNEITNSGAWGVNAAGVDDLDVMDNLIDDNLGGVIVEDSSEVDIIDNDILNNGDQGGVLVTDSDVVTVGNNLITGGSTIDISGSSDVVVEFNTLTGTGGINLTAITGVTEVNDNEVTDGSGGISLEDVSDGAAVTDNLVEENTDDGLVATTITGDVDVAGNDILTNAGDGVTIENVSDGDTTVEMNTVEENNANLQDNHGISVSEVADLFIEENEVTNNDDDGILVSDAMMVEVTANDVDSHDENGIDVADVDSADVMSNDVTDADDGIAVSDAAIDASVTDNEVEDVGTGIAIDAVGTEEPVDVERNELDMYDTGIHFEDFDEEQPPFAVYNDLLDEEADADVANDGPSTVEALFNYYDTDEGVSHSDIADNAAFDGDVLYDPFLTVPQSDVSVQEPENTQEFGHELTLEATPDTTDPQVVAFPASVDGTVEDVFSDLPAGASVFAYDAEADEFVPGGEMANESIGALDAFVVTDLDEDATIAFEYPSDGTASPGEKELEEGWNLVGAPKKTTVNIAFSSVLNGDEAQVNHLYGNAADQPDFVDDMTAERNGEPLWFESTEDASGEVPTFTVFEGDDGEQIVSPYTGYWVSIDSDDAGSTITGALPDSGADAVQEVEALQTSSTENELAP